MADTMQQVLVRLPKDMYEQLKSQANMEDRTVAAEVRRAVRSHLETSASR
jgi:predicted DNA-binding protein